MNQHKNPRHGKRKFKVNTVELGKNEVRVREILRDIESGRKKGVIRIHTRVTNVKAYERATMATHGEKLRRLSKETNVPLRPSSEIVDIEVKGEKALDDILHLLETDPVMKLYQRLERYSYRYVVKN